MVNLLMMMSQFIIPPYFVSENKKSFKIQNGSKLIICLHDILYYLTCTSMCQTMFKLMLMLMNSPGGALSKNTPLVNLELSALQSGI